MRKIGKSCIRKVKRSIYHPKGGVEIYISGQGTALSEKAKPKDIEKVREDLQKVKERKMTLKGFLKKWKFSS